MIKIVGIADTHASHMEVKPPDGDILVVAGDFCGYGKMNEVHEFNRWLGTLPHEYKIVVAGNHDLCLQGNPIGQHVFTNAIYLNEDAKEVAGILFYGSPWTPDFGNWAFMYHRNTPWAKRVWDRIPDATEVLITHGPPAGTRLGMTLGWRGAPPEDAGCQMLRDRILELPKLRATFHGHIHCGYGVEKVGNVLCHNVAVVNEEYDVTNHGLIYEYEGKGDL